jgi:hypothetical protein
MSSISSNVVWGVSEDGLINFFYFINAFLGYLYGWNISNNFLITQLHISKCPLVVISSSEILSIPLQTSILTLDLPTFSSSVATDQSDSFVSSLLWIGDSEGNLYSVVERKKHTKFVKTVFLSKNIPSF